MEKKIWKWEEYKDISNLSHFKTKSSSRYYYEINNIADISSIKEIMDFWKIHNLNIIFIWGWTNLLFAFDIYEWIIIKNNLVWFEYNEQTKILQVYSGESVSKIASTLEYHFHQSLWHRFIWLPWTFGWAICGNAGCFGLETESNFVSVEVYNKETGTIETLDKDKVEFWYRTSIFKQTEKYFILKATFDLSYKKEKYSSDVDVLHFRNEIQPIWNSCGSFFKNPSSEFPAGKLIQEVWLKWFHYNWAFFSQKHANFLMMEKVNWDYHDLLYLIELAKDKVQEKFWISLEPEVRIIHSM
jgi:UDP-N-acetylmuramate dehydrogenase